MTSWLVRTGPALALVVVTTAAWAMFFPRGPQTGWAGAVTVLGAGGVGVLLGWWARRWPRQDRWGLVGLAVVLAVCVREVFRLAQPVPSQGGMSVAALWRGSTFAWGALLLGRGVDLLLTVPALLLGVGLAAAPRRWWRWWRALVGAALAMVLLVPAWTPGSAGREAGVETFKTGGCRHRVVVRGKVGAPVLVFWSGGPGGSEIGTLRTQWAAIEREFTVVVWDQTGAGLNAACFPRDGRLRLPRLEDDAIAMLRWADQRFGRRPTLVANSWGTFLGVLVLRDHPELVHAYVGSGQMVDLAATDRIFYDDTLAWARARGETGIVDRLETQGPPPYGNVWPYEELFAHEGDWNAWGRAPEVGAAVDPLANVMDKPELDSLAKIRYALNIVDSFGSLYPTVQGIDFRQDATTLGVPVYLAQGEHEARGRQELAQAWFEVLQAPTKEWISFAGSGHKAFGEEPEAFLALLRRAAGVQS